MSRKEIEREIQQVWPTSLGVTPPQWIRDFLEDPRQAVAAALDGSYYFGSLNAVAAEHLLLDWAKVLGPSFRAQLHSQVLIWLQGCGAYKAFLILRFVGPDGTYGSQEKKRCWGAIARWFRVS